MNPAFLGFPPGQCPFRFHTGSCPYKSGYDPCPWGCKCKRKRWQGLGDSKLAWGQTFGRGRPERRRARSRAPDLPLGAGSRISAPPFLSYEDALLREDLHALRQIDDPSMRVLVASAIVLANLEVPFRASMACIELRDQKGDRKTCDYSIVSGVQDADVIEDVAIWAVRQFGQHRVKEIKFRGGRGERGIAFEPARRRALEMKRRARSRSSQRIVLGQLLLPVDVSANAALMPARRWLGYR